MTPWHQRFSDLASLVASWSKDEGAKVGAVIVDSQNRIISTGFNGYPQGIQDVSLNKERKLMRTIHAEVNAILFAQRNLSGTTLYCTHHPCSHCAALIIQSGISQVICPSPEGTDLSAPWRQSMEEAGELFIEALIPVIYY